MKLITNNNNLYHLYDKMIYHLYDKNLYQSLSQEIPVMCHLLPMQDQL